MGLRADVLALNFSFIDGTVDVVAQVVVLQIAKVLGSERILFFLKAVREVCKTAVGFDAIEALVGGGAVEGAQICSVRAQLYVVEGFGLKAVGQLLSAAVPSGLDASLRMLFEEGEESLHLGWVVVAAHESDAGDFAVVVAGECQEPFEGEFFANVAKEDGAVATRALVRAERKVDGKRHLVGKFLENDVVGQVF